MEIKISEITHTDIDQLAACNRAVLPVYYQKIHYLQFILADEYLLLKATSGADFLGYIIGRLENSSRFHIITFGVYPKYRRLGLGTKLMAGIEKMALDKFPSIRFMTLYVQTSNESAIGFYERYGLKRIQYKENYYGPDDHGYTYGKKVSAEEELSESESANQKE